MAPQRILSGRILVLKLSRLGHVPPGWYGTEILAEAGLPITVLEFSSENQGLKQWEGSPLPKFARYRFGPGRWIRALPPWGRVLGTLLSTLGWLAARVRSGDRPVLAIGHGLQEQLILCVLNKAFGLPYAVHVHEVYEPDELSGLARLFFLFERAALSQAEFLIFPEKRRAEIYRKRYALKNRIHVVYNCPRLNRADIPARDLRQELNIPPSHLIVGYMGGVGRTNALVELVESLPHVPHATVLIWGWADSRYRSEILAAREKHRLGDRVRILGEVEDKWGHLKGCDVLYCVYGTALLRTRHQATASNKFTEALACGVPVLAHASGGFPEALAETQAGMAIADLTPQTLSQALKSLQDAALRATYGQNGRRAYLAQYHYEHQFAPVLDDVRKSTNMAKVLDFQQKRLRAAG